MLSDAKAGCGRYRWALLLVWVVGAGGVQADAYLEMLEMEAAKIGESTVSQEVVGPEKEQVGEGFSPALTREEFVAEMRSRHPGGNVMFVRLSPQERDRIYSEYYLKGASYEEVVDVMDRWLRSR